jgi:hypothetical protein
MVSANPTRVVGPFRCLDATPLAERQRRRVELGQRCRLTTEEAAICLAAGRRRSEVAAAKGRWNMRRSDRRDEDIHIQGLVGEFAFCRLFGLVVEAMDDAHRTASTETRFDAVMPDGRTVDCKTSTHPDSDLLVALWKEGNPPSLYALMIYENPPPALLRKAQPSTASEGGIDRLDPLPVVSFRGFAPSAYMFDACNIRWFSRRGDRDAVFCVPQRLLRELDQVDLPWPTLEAQPRPTRMPMLPPPPSGGSRHFVAAASIGRMGLHHLSPPHLLQPPRQGVCSATFPTLGGDEDDEEKEDGEEG